MELQTNESQFEEQGDVFLDESDIIQEINIDEEGIIIFIYYFTTSL